MKNLFLSEFDASDEKEDYGDNEIICMELKNEDYYSKAKYFYLEEYK